MLILHLAPDSKPGALLREHNHKFNTVLMVIDSSIYHGINSDVIKSVLNYPFFPIHVSDYITYCKRTVSYAFNTPAKYNSRYARHFLNIYQVMGTPTGLVGQLEVILSAY